MAKANWVTVAPSSGSGNATVNVTSNGPHTGRNLRTSILTWKAAGVDDQTRYVSQAGKPEFVDVADTAVSEQAGQLVTISGVSNSARLTFSLGSGDLEISIPGYYIANSLQTANGALISGDPGASAEYNFSIAITVPANTGVAELTRQIIVTNEAGQKDTCTLTLAAGNAYLEITLGTIELGWEGNPVAVTVQSNTTWRIV